MSFWCNRSKNLREWVKKNTCTILHLKSQKFKVVLTYRTRSRRPNKRSEFMHSSNWYMGSTVWSTFKSTFKSMYFVYRAVSSLETFIMNIEHNSMHSNLHSPSISIVDEYEPPYRQSKWQSLSPIIGMYVSMLMYRDIDVDFFATIFECRSECRTQCPMFKMYWTSKETPITYAPKLIEGQAICLHFDNLSVFVYAIPKEWAP